MREQLTKTRRHRPVDRANHPEGRHRIGSECTLVGVFDRRADRHAAWIRVLDDRAGRQRELAEQQPRGREVEEVDQRQLLAVELLDAREQVDTSAVLHVVRGALVRVLAVAQLCGLRE